MKSLLFLWWLNFIGDCLSKKSHLMNLNPQPCLISLKDSDVTSGLYLTSRVVRCDDIRTRLKKCKRMQGWHATKYANKVRMM